MKFIGKWNFLPKEFHYLEENTFLIILLNSTFAKWERHNGNSFVLNHQNSCPSIIVARTHVNGAFNINILIF